MSRSSKRILFIGGGAVGLLVLVVSIVLMMGVNRYKPRFEAAASSALGMDVRIGGRLGMGFLPGFHVTAGEGRILDNQGVVVASATRVRLWIDLLPLLRRELRVRRIELRQPRLSVVRDPEGGFNVAPLKKAAALLDVLDGASVSISGGTLHYTDRKSGEGIEAEGFSLTLDPMRLRRDGSAQLFRRVSLRGRLACAEIRTKNLTLSDLEASVDGKDGVFAIEPFTMSVFGGRLAGSLHADLAASVPRCQIKCSLPHFRIEEFLKTLSPKKAAEGAMNFSASLSMQGRTVRQLLETAAGEGSLRGENIVLEGHDLDRVLSRFDSSQNFNLVDVGAVFLAGPLGLVVTKGYNFASLFAGSGGSSRIRTVVSDWRVERGVAQATDVALATSENRIALQGRLDFVNEQFVDVNVAAIDAKGCVRVRQVIRGPFAKPAVEKPRVLTSLAGPVLKLYRRTRGIFPAGPCEVFYSGSVAAPR